MDIAFLIGRIIVGIYFLMNAYSHLFKGSHMTGYAGSKGVPSPRLAVAVSGILLLIGGLSILFGVWVVWGVVSLLVFLLPVTFIMHNYWKESDPNAKAAQKIAFMKNSALIGFLLMILAVPAPWAYSAL